MDEINISKSKAFVDFMLTQQQWSGITKQDVDRWLHNFRDLDQEEQRLVYKLLTNIIYFSEKDVIAALREGVFKCLAYDDILATQIAAKFNLSQNALKNVYEEKIRETCFVPLLDSDSPHESGNYVSRTLVQQGIVSTNRSMFIDKVPGILNSGLIKNLVIVDDCVGSGEQLRGFWQNKLLEDGSEKYSIKELCHKYGVRANYLTLFGYDKSIEDLRIQFDDLSIFCIRTLSESHRVFSDSTYIWSDEGERDKAFSLFDSLSKNAGIPTYGYAGLDFAFIMHQTIPDWSLPLFWKENSDWNLLVRRKNSND